jgi:inositol polyphosphate 5-phosphatase INPP5B/F
MDGRESEFTKSPVPGSLFCGTWNVNAKKQEGGLHDWLMPKSCTAPVDIYAIGFQEIVDLNASNVLLDGSKTVERSKFWQQRIEDCLTTKKGATGGYTLVMSKSLVGLLLCVYVSNRMMPYVTDVRATHQATGIMGVMGNKGGVCIRLSVYDTSLCFVCAHLAAHRENVVGRNADFKTIVEGIQFPAGGEGENDGGKSDVRPAKLDPRAGSSEVVTRPLRGSALNLTRDLELLKNHELVFWLGDLNYRIDDSITTDEVFARIEKGDLASLRELDQLNIEVAKKTAFQGFSEGTLNFEPTYKYQPGTDNYDRRPDKKIRAPAWCDRVLWRSTLDAAMYPIELKAYERSNLVPSDHKPVSAQFMLKFRERSEKASELPSPPGVLSCQVTIVSSSAATRFVVLVVIG